MNLPHNISHNRSKFTPKLVMSSLPPIDSLDTMRVFELKAALKSAGLDSEGGRSELVRNWRGAWPEPPLKSIFVSGLFG